MWDTSLRFKSAVIPSAGEGSRKDCLITQRVFVCESDSLRDPSTSLRSAQDDRGANRAFAHFRW
jgi:hypothetical protein